MEEQSGQEFASADARAQENQPTLRAEAESYFASIPRQELDIAQSLDKAHGRLEIRTHKVSRSVGWVGSDRAFPAPNASPGWPSSA
jgi:hypothetical protein